MNKKAKEAIEALEVKRKESLTRHLYLVYWHMVDSIKRKWAEDGWSEITTDHVKLITVIAADEQLSNSELAKRVGVTKQAMSQMVTLLQKRGILDVKPDPDDSRAKLISLSDYGIEFIFYFSSSTEDILKKYTKILGKDKMKMLMEITKELADGLIELESQSYFTDLKKKISKKF